MGALDKIKQLKDQGVSDEEIPRRLNEEGMPPKEIQDGLAQDKIKKAISTGERQGMESSVIHDEFYVPQPSMKYNPKAQEVGETPPPMQNPVPSAEYAPQETTPKEEYYSPQPAQDPIPSAQEYTPQEAILQEEYYPQEGYEDASYSGTGNTDSIIEIAEQVFAEKIGKIEKQIRGLNEFKTIAQTKIEILLERLQKIEKIIDNLQVSILNKIGSYGDNLQSIKNEMSMMQDSFRKVIYHPTTKHNSTKKVLHKKHSKK